MVNHINHICWDLLKKQYENYLKTLKESAMQNDTRHCDNEPQWQLVKPNISKIKIDEGYIYSIINSMNAAERTYLFVPSPQLPEKPMIKEILPYGLERYEVNCFKCGKCLMDVYSHWPLYKSLVSSLYCILCKPEHPEVAENRGNRAGIMECLKMVADIKDKSTDSFQINCLTELQQQLTDLLYKRMGL